MLTLEELAKREAAGEAWGTQSVQINLEPAGHTMRARPHMPIRKKVTSAGMATAGASLLIAQKILEMWVF